MRAAERARVLRGGTERVCGAAGRSRVDQRRRERAGMRGRASERPGLGAELGEAERGAALFPVCAWEERRSLSRGRGEDWFTRGLTLRVVNKRRLGLWSSCLLCAFTSESPRALASPSPHRRNAVGSRTCARRRERG